MFEFGLKTLFLIWVVSSIQLTVSQIDGGLDPAIVPILTQYVYNNISKMTLSIFTDQLQNKSSFCIQNINDDWNQAFNFSNLDFVSECLLKYNDLPRRLCTVAEAEFYFSSLYGWDGSTSYLNPNRNCNLTTWLSGCEPGWACGLDMDQQNVDLKESKAIPSRTADCQPCCEGFFCPHGITCMIPCPLGSYCPLATLNQSTGVCEPYTYQIPPGRPNHTCGGANIWADVITSREIFCPAGSYCPTTTEESACSSGHYCRLGSTSEKGCFKLASCNPNTTNQNIHAYGVMLMVGLSTLLLIMYNCSDQVLTIRERRQAKSRDAAAKSARETVKAHERWKLAKDAAMKHATGLQVQLSRTFSRKKYARDAEKVKILEEDLYKIDDHMLEMQPSTSTKSLPSFVTSKGKNEPEDLKKVEHEIEEDPGSDENVHVEMKDKKVKKHKPKGKKINTDSQIFEYAYAQIEKEKAIQQQNKNLTFSGVIAMATNPELKRRPTIEVAFKDLTLTLKGKNKHLLRCVTGKIVPGRVTSVMGPSGAGKTTFLSALAGKATGCTRSGMILVNGKNESIHSYKKIIGFVPQDDIVHGNLTVEENLWFSARCRLSAALPKADKVLIVERVIESLGLQGVRSSLVGTVEKRGISGGQRKRVNVGLEMVMEPSLLILDEPTSGLDSSSSQLLLRALRREALEGVNVCMVVHQPSYTLFKMFDDLILLAKGGLTVYHGPVKKVEEYFGGLGITVPDRVNPPDYFIDILERMVKPSTSSTISCKELPVRWMLHNGYPVPPDMHEEARIAMRGHASPYISPANSTAMEEMSFAGELWQDVCYNVEMHRDKLQHNFLRSKDLSNRRTPIFLNQYKYFLGRVGKQRLRESRIQAVDYLILLLAGACLGSIAKVSDESFGAPGYTYTIIAYWRESASGMSSLACFLAKDTIDHFNTVIKPLVYLSMFYFFNNPRSTFQDNYIVLLCLVYCVTGIAYLLAISLQPGPAQLSSVLLPVVLTLVATQQNNTKILTSIAKYCYPKMALEAFVISNAERYYGVWLITRCGALYSWNYNINDWDNCIIGLIVTGLIFRVIAYICLLTFQRK
ncbi:ABC transporter-like, ATP-binding domain [Dillenia turbinata]|uniref:ABC transporter-like, ATP-binding domain n=1 Tax=Dillenia turbinata TaxID=194707 RepID=A0AAN8VK79_9MAGN